MHAGVGLLSFSPHEQLGVAAMPLGTLAASDLESPRARPSSAASPPGFRGCEYAVATHTQLWHIAYRSLSSLLPVVCQHSCIHYRVSPSLRKPWLWVSCNQNIIVCCASWAQSVDNHVEGVHVLQAWVE